MGQLTSITGSRIKRSAGLTKGSSGARRGEDRSERRRVCWASTLKWAARINFYPRVLGQQNRIFPHSSEARKSMTSPSPAYLRHGKKNMSPASWVTLCVPSLPPKDTYSHRNRYPPDLPPLQSSTSPLPWDSRGVRTEFRIQRCLFCSLIPPNTKCHFSLNNS